MDGPTPALAAAVNIPVHGRPAEEVLADIRAYGARDADFRGGRTWSMVYWAGEEHHRLVERAHDLHLADNALNPIAFQGVKRMEREVVQMSLGLLHAPSGAGGTMTSGGTESLLLAVKAWRDHARRRWPWIRRPNVVAPITIHPAFMKAGHLFGVRIKTVRADPDGEVDPRRLARAIDRNTVLVAASAPQYVTGSVDPIPEIARACRRRGVPLHVDACFGGFILPWLERRGVSMPPWDFRVEGVSSLSADLHKFGYAAKGASVLLYREKSAARNQFFVYTDWPGGIYLSPGLPGTRPGGPIAAAWAALQGMGESGYLELAASAWEVAERLRAGIAGIDGLRVMGRPHSTVVTWTSTTPEVNVYAVADRMQSRGWSVDRQQSPPSVHCTCNASNLPVVDTYLEDLAAAVREARANPALAREGEAAVYGLMARVPIRGFVKGAVLDLMEQLADPEGAAAGVDLGRREGGVEALAGRALDLVDRARAAVRRGSRRG